MNVLVRVRGRYWYYFGKWRWKERRVLTLNENLIVIRHEGNLEERFLLSGSSIVTQHFYAPLAHCVMIKCSNDKIERPIVGFYEEGDCNAFLIQCKNTIKRLGEERDALLAETFSNLRKAVVHDGESFSPKKLGVPRGLQILCFAMGTRGDVQPFLALGTGLQNAPMLALNVALNNPNILQTFHQSEQSTLPNIVLCCSDRMLWHA